MPTVFDSHGNFGYSIIATTASPAISGTSIVVRAGDGAKFPAPPFNATVCPANSLPLSSNAEIVRVTAITTDTFTIIRQQEGSSARSILVGDQIFDSITVKDLTDIENAVNAGGGGGGVVTSPSVTLTVAASNATAHTKASADYVCTGTNDDVIINSAIAALPSTGGLCLLSAGTFSLGSIINFQKDYSSLLGMGRSATILSLHSGFVSTTALSCDRKDLGTGTSAYRPCANIEVGNFTVIGNQVGTQSTTDGIYFSAFRSKLRDVDVYQMNGCGVRVRGVPSIERANVGGWSCYGTIVTDSKIHENGNGGINYDAESTDSALSRCEIFQNAGPGFQTGAVVNEISHCYIWQNFDQSVAGGSALGNGLQFKAGSGRTNIVSNKIEQNRTGLNFIAGSGFTVVGNIFASNSTSATTSSSTPSIPAGWIIAGANNVKSDIEFNGSGGAPDGVLMVGNYISPQTYGSDASAYAIKITAGTHIMNRFNHLLTGNTGFIQNTMGPSNIFSSGQNVGYITEASGTATITSAATSVVVTHGLSVTPLVQDINVTLSNQPSNALGNIWISSIGATTFTINVAAAPGTNTAVFGWSVETHRFS